MSIAPDFSMFLQYNHQLDNVIFAGDFDQEAIVCYSNKCFETTLLNEISWTLQSPLGTIQVLAMMPKSKLGLKHLIKEGSRMILTAVKGFVYDAMPVSF